MIFLSWAAAALVFFLLHLVPGDPAVAILGEGADSTQIYRLRSRLHLDQPLYRQYLQFNHELINFQLGRSLFDNKPVVDHLFKRLPNTLFLAFAALLPALFISFPLGAWAAFREGRPVHSIVTVVTSVGVAIPNFFLGALLVLLFSVTLNLLPVSGTGGVRYVILPALTLGLSMSAMQTRIIRTAVGRELNKPYILLARAKGLSNYRIFKNHVLKNAMIPVITTLGLQIGALITGTFITETVFSWHGIGSLLVQSIKRRDYPMVQGIALFITLTYLLIHFLVDISYFFLDPRIRHEIPQD